MDAPDATHFREIPYNYTSADDERVVRILLGDDAWARLHALRDRRVTGRSAKHLLRFVGDLFLVRRNPFAYQDLVASRSRRKAFLAQARLELDTVDAHDQGDPDVAALLGQCRAAWRDLARELGWAGLRQARIRVALGAVVGPDNVAFDPFTLTAHATDATDWRLHLPLCVAFPTRESQVAPLLAAIARLKLKAIPRGAATGLTGGCVPLAADCVMVNTERLDAIRGIAQVQDTGPDGAPRTVSLLEVEAGVITEDAIRYAEHRHHVFATDPTSAWACTIGGNIAENAGGKTAVLWGTCIDNLWSYRIALPTGARREVRRIGHPMRKILPGDTVRFDVVDEAGRVERTVALRGDEIRKPGLWKDITNKALGGVPGLQKEGCDGVITSARFVLHRPYEHKATFCLEFFGPDMREASRVIGAMADAFPDRGNETLMALEHFDEEYVDAIDYRTKCPRGGRPKAVLLVDMVAHDAPALARGRARLESLLAAHPNTCLYAAADAAEAERIWQDRKKMGAIARRTNAFKLNEDIVLPLAALADFAGWIDDANLAEERHNHRELAARLRALLEADGTRDDPWIAGKLPRALELLDQALARIASADRMTLRSNAVAHGLRDALVDLFSGHAAVTTRIAAILDAVRARLIVLATHMHAGDGNVHVNIPVFSNDREMMLRAAATADAAMERAVALGGVVSGEHGIGVTKIRHLEPARLEALAAYRRAVDPDGVMNPGKLSDPTVVDRVFTPSFNLLELEARILKHDSLEVLADRISPCVRCGKCKPDCCTFHPGRGMFYHPRNKNLAIAAVIEALLYDAQRTRSTRFEALRDLEQIADHCTLCHRCLKPCPVGIDTAEVSLLERRILRDRKFKHTPVTVRMSLFYLLSKSRAFNAVFRRVVLAWGSAVQRLGVRLVALVPGLATLRRRKPLALLQSPMPAPSPAPLHRFLPRCTGGQALRVAPPGGDATRTVFYFPGCGSERMHGDVSRAALYVLLKAGVQVVLPPPFLCCGFPHQANARDRQQGRQVLQDTIIFSQVREMLRYLDFQAVVVTCGTCMDGLRHMGAEGIFGAPLVDAGRFALDAGLAVPGPVEPVLYHRPCHDSMGEAGMRVLAGRAGVAPTAMPHCCSEAGTLSLSRPDITGDMLDRKARAIREALAGRAPGTPILTHCPACLTGLGRNARLGAVPRHVTVHLATRAGGPGWRDELQPWLDRAEVVTF